MLEDRDVKSRKWTESSSWGWAPRLFLAQVLPPAKACPAPASQPPFLHLLQREGRMSEPSWKSSQPLASEQRSVRGGGGGDAQAARVPGWHGAGRGRGTQRSANTKDTSCPPKGSKTQECCQDPEHCHGSGEETQEQTPQKTGEGGRRGDLAGVPSCSD